MKTAPLAHIRNPWSSIEKKKRAQRNGAKHHTSFTFSLLNDYVLKRRQKTPNMLLLQAQSSLFGGSWGN